MVELKNYRRRPINIIHMQGRSRIINDTIFNELYENTKELYLPEDLTIISTWTDDDKCFLKKQLDKYGIDLINSYIPTDEEWHNPYKIKCIYNTLKNVKTKYVLILDGYDVLILTFDLLMRRFMTKGYKAIFNATKFNFPNVDVGIIKNSEQNLGDFCYFNAGCCIGETDYLLSFYKDAYDIIDMHNPYDSEQYILRNVFSKRDLKDVYINWESDIFQTFGNTTINYIGNNECIIK